MPINITMPALSPTMEVGNLAKWLVKEGDTVKSGDVIAEIETDKATMEVEAVDEGKIAKLVVPAGTQGVKVNAVIAILAVEGEDASSAFLPAGKVSAAPTDGGGAASAAPAQKAPAPAAAPASLPPSAASGGTSPARGEAGERTFASPLARRIAREAGVDVASIAGSGPKGRVVKADVDAAISGGYSQVCASRRSGSSGRFCRTGCCRTEGHGGRSGSETVRRRLVRAGAA